MKTLFPILSSSLLLSHNANSYKKNQGGHFFLLKATNKCTMVILKGLPKQKSKLNTCPVCGIDFPDMHSMAWENWRSYRAVPCVNIRSHSYNSSQKWGQNPAKSTWNINMIRNWTNRSLSMQERSWLFKGTFRHRYSNGTQAPEGDGINIQKVGLHKYYMLRTRCVKACT